jgi:DNA-binding cell septation regulator SpoVG
MRPFPFITTKGEYRKMEVTNVYFRELNSGKSLKAYANVEFDGTMIVNGFKVFEGVHGPFARVPQEKGGDKWYDTVRWSEKGFYEEGAGTHPVLEAVVERWKAYKDKRGKSESNGDGAEAPW